jgi:sugar O-acyltransferase (sialic acid O-acetyltransferase NeuD family)
MGATTSTPTDRRDFVLIGAGGFGRETVEVARAVAHAGGDLNLIGFLDDDPSLQDRCFNDVPVLGPLDALDALDGVMAIVCTGSPADFTSRRRIVDRLGLPNERYATLLHPSAVVPPSVHLGDGCVLQAQVVATTDVSVGKHVLVMPGAVLTHDDFVRDHVTIGARACLAGGVEVEAGAYVGAGVLVREGRTIGAGSLVGMGSVVVTDIPPGQVWCGNPARYLRDVPQSQKSEPDAGAASSNRSDN